MNSSGLHVKVIAGAALLALLVYLEASAPRVTRCAGLSVHLNATIASSGDAPPGLRIPRILHHVYLAGLDAYLNATSAPGAVLRRNWGDSCLDQHPSWAWTHRFWDRAAAEALLGSHYPWMLPAWRRYQEIDPDKGWVMQADALRVVLMHHEGGLYLDHDVECFRPSDGMLAGADVVLQATDWGAEGVTNGVLAGIPGHPLWLKALQLMTRRADWALENTEPLRQVIVRTGPKVIRDALLALGLDPGQPTEAEPNPWAGRHTLRSAKDGGGGGGGGSSSGSSGGGSAIQIHPLGSFFTPCLWGVNSAADCTTRLVLQRAAGTTSRRLVGWHRYTGTWMGKHYRDPAKTLAKLMADEQRREEEEE